jgi:ketosteroid isomerase-like protein
VATADADLIAVAEAAYERLNAGDLDGFLALVSEDVEFTSLVAELEGTTFRGHDGVRDWWEGVRGSFLDPSWELLDIRPQAEGYGVIKVRMAGVLSGAPVTQHMWQASRMEAGKVTWWAFYRTEEEALEAARPRAQPGS